MCLVTGGSSGLGKATVDLLLEQGHRVAAFDLQAAENPTSSQSSFLSICGNVCSEDQVKSAIDLVLSTFGRLDFVLNCAGIMLIKPIYDVDTKEVHPMKEFQNVINANLLGTFNVCRLAVEAMMKNTPDAGGQRGVIINTSSVTGLDGFTNSVAYSASKAAVAGITVPLARELGKFGIRVLAIAPGAFHTPLITAPNLLKNIIPMIPFPTRPGNPTEFAKLVIAIIENPYLNGEIIRLDAGLRAFN